MEIHETLQKQLSEELRHQDTVNWFEPKMSTFKNFMEEVDQWKKSQKDQILIAPHDSISNAPSKSSSTSSKSSSVASARIKATAERARLLARAAALKQKHALDMEKAQLQARMEQLEMETSMAESDAILKVLESSDPQKPPLSQPLFEPLSHPIFQTQVQSDGMDDYLKEYKAAKDDVTIESETSESGFKGVRTVPKTPLQMYFNPAPRPRDAPKKDPQPADAATMTGNYDNAAVMQRQKDIADLLVLQHRQTSLPAREIPIFDGNPLNYQPFMKAFQHGIEDKTTSCQDRLYYLEQYTTGPCRELVRSCLHMDSAIGFTEAKRLLKVHFGDEMMISNAYIGKALNWNIIKAEDGKALHNYALFLRSCCNVMGDLGGMEELDLPSNLKLMISKLPYKLKERWRTIVFDILERTGRRAKLRDLVEFMERQARILQDPIFGDLHDPPANVKPFKTKTTTESKLHRFKSKGSSFATSVAMIPDTQAGRSENKAPVKENLPSSVYNAKSCIFCAGKHSLAECQKINTKSHEVKIDFLRDNGLCFGCLRVGHLSRNCKRRMTCQDCQAKHPTILHIERSSKTEMDTSKPYKAEQNAIVARPEETSISSALVSLEWSERTGAGKDCLLAIVPVRVKLCNGSKSVTTYAFLDPGSTDTFCTEKLMRQLNARGRRAEVLLQTMGTEKIVKSYELTGLEVGNMEDGTFLKLPKVYTQTKIPVTKRNILTQTDLNRWPYLQEIQVKEFDADVDLLIGVNTPKAMEPWRIINSQGNGPYAVKTLLGWVVNGPLNSPTSIDDECPTALVNRISIVHIEKLLENQYTHDFPEKAYEEKREMSVEDQKFMQIASSSVTLKNGHYHLPLPLQDRNIFMPNNYQMAEQRVLHLKRKLQKDKMYASEYKDFMSDIIRKGYADKIPQKELQGEKGRIWYIPHHGVYHKRKKTIRAVFDCAARYKGTSLNQVLLQGPDLANSLIGVLLRFRQEHVAIMADIEGMFHQVRVNEEDVDFLRFLWWPDGDTSKELEEYRMRVHLFGAVSSPTCANFALQKTAEDNSHKFDGEVADTIKSNFYVDDCLKSVPTEKQAVELVMGLREICSLGGFKLTKWVSTSRAVLATIPDEDRAKKIKNMDLDREKLPNDRALGLYWDIESDIFSFRVTVNNKALTRRSILSTVSSVYDPLGLLAPFTLKAKQILQQLCKAKYGWDEAIPLEFSRPWQQWLKDLDQLAKFQVDRCLKPKNFGPVRTAQLHTFCDASEQGYGTASYLRFMNDKGETHIAFVMGKARVTPLKNLTIPRLELTAATLAARMDKMLQSELQVKLQESIFWTDSQSVLKYIRNKTRRFHTFVRNRIAVIHDLSEVNQWRFVDSKHNPADDASRGLSIEAFLSSETWLQGPEFLGKSEAQWPGMPEELGSILPDDPEVRREVTVTSIVTSMMEKPPTNRLIEYYSSWHDLKKAIVWMLKLKELLLQMSQKRKEAGLKYGHDKGKSLKDQINLLKMSSTHAQSLSVKDMENAERAIIYYEQRQHYKEERSLLEKGKDCSRGSSLYKLDPIDDCGILRVGGRTRKMAMPMELKHPMIIPKHSHIANLILRHIHQKVGHTGRGHMLSKLHQRYWLSGANSLARKVIKNCVICRRQQAKAGEQKMSDLPLDRITPDLPPFTHVGIDYFGPIEVKRGRAHVKRWGVIFTCLVSRAVHLEVASHLNTDACINALRRFICRRGSVRSIRSDRGTNFVGAHKELEESVKQLDNDKIQNSLLKRGIDWMFNPPAGAHHGGVWERLIRSVKKVLYSVLKEQTLDDDALHTALCEVEAILNDRPITTVTNDLNDLEPLTPNHLLQLKTNPIMPPGLFQKRDLYSQRKWRQVQYLADLFWKRWIREYLPLMQERHKWSQIKRNFTPGDVVVIIDDNAPRNSWLLGRVVKAFPGSKGLVRSVLVKTKSNIIQRPITKLCLLLEADN